MKNLSEEKKFIYLVWAKNTNTKEFCSFWHWADNPDEALYNIDRDFFNAPTVGLQINNCTSTIKNDKKIIFPREKMRILSIQKFNKNEAKKMIDKMNEDARTKYSNGKE